MNTTPHTWKETLRLQTWQLLQKGWRQRHIAEVPGVSVGAISQWLKRARTGSPQVLCYRPPPGAPRQLATEQLARLPDLLHCGPKTYGFRGEIWTRKRMAEVIRLACG